MTEEEKQNKKAVYQLACLVKDSAYCEFCPVSDVAILTLIVMMLSAMYGFLIGSITRMNLRPTLMPVVTSMTS